MDVTLRFVADFFEALDIICHGPGCLGFTGLLGGLLLLQLFFGITHGFAQEAWSVEARAEAASRRSCRELHQANDTFPWIREKMVTRGSIPTACAGPVSIIHCRACLQEHELSVQSHIASLVSMRAFAGLQSNLGCLLPPASWQAGLRRGTSTCAKRQLVARTSYPFRLKPDVADSWPIHLNINFMIADSFWFLFAI